MRGRVLLVSSIQLMELMVVQFLVELYQMENIIVFEGMDEENFDHLTLNEPPNDDVEESQKDPVLDLTLDSNSE